MTTSLGTDIRHRDLGSPAGRTGHRAETGADRRRRQLTPRWRKAVVLLHVVASVGWLGVTATFVVLTLAMLGVRDATTLRGAYGMHELLVIWLARPSAIATLVTGLVLSFGTRWGLVRYWWVLAKLVLLVATVVATIAVSPPVLAYAVEHADAAGTPEYDGAQRTLVLMALYHVVMIGTAAALSIYKPGSRLPAPRPRNRR